ncbi:MAG: hypothetical protein HUJ75_08560, partial [Parasporobacterium sp.]|nr:hypothetical protein [Parasporobacterium sp.]
EKVKAAVEKLNEELKAEPCEKTAAEALEVMLFYDRNVMDDSILLGFRAAESLAVPLVEYLSTDTACSILARYITLNNPKEMMPKQYELYKALSLKADTGIKEKKFLLKGKGELKKRKSIFGNKNK